MCYVLCMAAGFSRIGAAGVGYDFLRTGRVIWLNLVLWIAGVVFCLFVLIFVGILVAKVVNKS